MKSHPLKVEVWRSSSGGQFDRFEVPRLNKQTILDVVTYIQRQLDNTLSYRYSCRVGMCGTCAMTVNGVPRWTCRTQAAKFDSQPGIRIEPIKNFPVVKDLVVNMDPFFDKWQSAGNVFRAASPEATDFAKVKPDSTNRQAANQAIECIGCGVCNAACDVVKWSPDYLGPAALNRLWTLYNDERQGSRNQLLAHSATDAGCLGCHTTQSCTRHCPKELDPSGSIAGLKRQALRSLW